MTETNRSGGYALITSLIVTMIVTGLVIGFISTVHTEQKIARNDTDYSNAFYAAEGALEKLNSDLSKLFQQSVFPTQAAINGLEVAAMRPTLTGVTYSTYEIVGGQSTRLSAAMTAAATVATVLSTTDWPTTGYFMVDTEEIIYTGLTATTFTGLTRSGGVAHTNNAMVSRSKVISIAEGPNAGLNAQVIPFTLEAVARAGAGSEARLNRQVQVALIPVFQFGVFSDSDLSFYAGALFNFGGRIHTNGNLFLAAGGGTSTTLSQKVTVASHVIRQELANGISSADRTGQVYILQSAGSCNPAPGACRNLLITEGSKTLGPTSANRSGWPNTSLTTYNGNILNIDTGAKPLVLPFAGGDASPIEIIRRPPDDEDADSIIGQSRLYNQASLRILLSDLATNLPGDTGVPLNAGIIAAPYNYVYNPVTHRPPFAQADAGDPDFVTAANADITAAGTELINGFIKIQRQNDDATWTDVTMEILNYGISSNQPNAIIRLQKLRWDATDVTNSITATDYSPINMFDPRESHWRTNSATANMPKIGIMNLIELDVAKMAQWFARTGAFNTGTGDQAISNNGYIVYISDRRGNRNGAGNETSEFGFEDMVNPAAANGAPNGTLQLGEDLNANAALDLYGANLPYNPWSASTDLYTTEFPVQSALIPMEIAEPLDNAETGIEVRSSAGVAAVPGYYRIDGEILNCTANAANVLTCTRAREGTAAAAHNMINAVLDEALDNAETGVDVTSAINVAAPAFFRIDNEIVYCTAYAAPTLTCERGRGNTAAVAHTPVSEIISEAIDNAETGISLGSVGTITVPGYYKMDNEIVYCTATAGGAMPSATCTRGAAGSAAVAHPGGSFVDLALDVTAAATTIRVGAAIAVPAYYRIENEIVQCTAYTSPNATCTRARLGTAGVAHDGDNAAVVVQGTINFRKVDTWGLNLWPSQKAAKNRVHYFRRAVRLVNGGNTNAANNLPTPGFTVATENPIYVLGNYNAYTGANGFTGPHSFSAVIADAVTLLSNAWDDNNSFSSPASSVGRGRSETNYRMAIAGGKGINFPRPANYEGDGDFGTDGGTHNFLRYLEEGGANAYYRGSIVSLYYYRQATGVYKCCNAVYGAPARQYAFDTDFLVPSQLPPGTPRFRDINNLSFRQTIRSDN